MNNQTLFRTLVVVAVAVVGAAAIATGAYNWGLAAGLAENGRAISAAAPAGPGYVYVWPRPWGFGFFPLFPLLFFFLFVAVLRGVWWRGPWRAGWGYRYDGVPPAFDEWHRRAHEAERQAVRSSTGST